MKIKVTANVIYHDILGKLVKGQIVEHVEQRIYNSIKDHVEVIEGEVESKVKAIEYDTKVLVQKAKTKVEQITKGAKK